MNLLQYTNHRPWPLPNRSWILFQSWRNNLFMHWKVQPNQLKPFIPDGLELDTYDGEAWASVVFLQIKKARPRWLPPLPGLSASTQINVRTYVRDFSGKQGVLFLKIGSNKRLIAAGMKLLFRLPCEYVNTFFVPEGNEIRVRSHVNNPPSVYFKGRECVYKPVSEPSLLQKGTLEYWLTERYCLFADGGSADGSRLLVGEIHHQPWLLQGVKVDLNSASPRNGQLRDSGFLSAQVRDEGVLGAGLLDLLDWGHLKALGLSAEPNLITYSQRQDTLIWPLRANGK